ncbi:hypothetical protein OUY22_03400 [Nonomuraea sp. MCN248]|uniref:Uncharacterized protein n=1 Tax=Nonomuraea corallina TaxID=2989783 RepID=A0ABT4S5X5_9ACTN|nr:hypothetical protein [Nonomuraea corallina]MDA0632448.1 hypothetical protein [Nonomuraea corallina]
MTEAPHALTVHGLGRRSRTLFRAVAAVAVVMMLGGSGCAGSGVKASYRPALLPVKLEWGNGNINITGETSIVTPVGVFSVGLEHSVVAKKADALYVIFRNRHASLPGSSVAGVDHIYEVMSGGGRFVAVVNGTATIEISDQEVLIDVTDGALKVVEFKGAQAVVQEQQGGVALRWQQFWDDCFYSPMGLSRWAYDDSTIDSWYGLGFLWFLFRLFFALILGVVDLVLTVGCFLAAVGFLVAGQTGRNIVYGVEVLVFLFVLFAGSRLA